MAGSELISKFQEIENRFNDAIITNDINEIKKCITDDWVLIDTLGGIISQERFFQVLNQGQLSHQSMTKEVLRVKVYGDLALVTGRGQNTGTWQGAPMSADEWITDVYKQEGSKWLCVLTHLTPVKKQVSYPHLTEQREKIIINYISGYNENNIEKMIRDFSGNIIFKNIYNGKTTMEISGINAFREEAAGTISHYQQRKQTIIAIKHNNDTAEVDIDYVATLAFDLQNGLKKGEQIELRGQSLFKFSGNQIVELTDIA